MMTKRRRERGERACAKHALSDGRFDFEFHHKFWCCFVDGDVCVSAFRPLILPLILTRPIVT